MIRQKFGCRICGNPVERGVHCNDCKRRIRRAQVVRKLDTTPICEADRTHKAQLVEVYRRIIESGGKLFESSGAPTCPKCGSAMQGGAPHGPWPVQWECRRCGYIEVPIERNTATAKGGAA